MPCRLLQTAHSGAGIQTAEEVHVLHVDQDADRTDIQMISSDEAVPEGALCAQEFEAAISKTSDQDYRCKRKPSTKRMVRFIRTRAAPAGDAENTASGITGAG